MTISISDLTGGEVQGSGMFDELMRTVKSQLQLEFDAGRITGVDYANTYLGAMTAALGTASQFILQYELTNQQLLLAQEQVQQAQEQTKLILAQIAKMEADTAISVKQLLVMDEQIAQAIQQTAMITEQIKKVTKDIEVSDKQMLVMDAQIVQTTAQSTLLDQQVINTTNENTTITKQQTKLDSEVSILNQKKLTEEAQILDTVASNTVAGVIGKQNALYAQQTESYKRDAEQKTAKILMETWTIQRTTDETFGVYDSFKEANIAPVIEKLIAGV